MFTPVSVLNLQVDNEQSLSTFFNSWPSKQNIWAALESEEGLCDQTDPVIYKSITPESTKRPLLALWLTRTEWHDPWRRRSWSRHHRWCTQLRCCPAGTGPLGLSSAARTTFLHTAMKRVKSVVILLSFLPFFLFNKMHACLCVSIPSPSWGQSPPWQWSCRRHRRRTDSVLRRPRRPAAGPA